MTAITILVPVLGRPHRVEPLLASLRASQQDVPLEPLFLPSLDDADELAALRAAGAPYETVGVAAESGQWAKKNNHAFRKLGTEWAFLAADDVVFHPGWAEEAVEVARVTGACVVGTNDTVNVRVRSGRHSTHTLVHRDYLECGTIDEDGQILHEGYGHWFVDDEFVQTAMHRGTFAPAPRAIVQHFHPVYGGAETDSTYEKGQASVMADKDIYEGRKHLWGR